MNSLPCGILICRYEPKYAKSLAEMWMNSIESWGGMQFNYDEAKILEQQANSSAIASFLALDGENVIGYVVMGLEHQDRACVWMLSVLPVYQGKGIGKCLLNRCMQQARELGIAQIALYTWAGNTQAVPLYKKCGYFWQDTESVGTYLINYLPMILESDLIKPYFEFFDWYHDLQRELKIEPDGEKRDGFTYYTYLWHKQGKSLRVVVERRSCAIVEIECEDFHIKSRVCDAKPVFGNKEQIIYEIKVYNPDYRELKIQGIAEHNIAFDFYHESVIDGQIMITAAYELLPITSTFSENVPLPSVRALISLGGKCVSFGYSQDICFPVEISLVSTNRIMPDYPCTMYLNLKSRLKQDARLRLSFPDDAIVKLAQAEYQTDLGALAESMIETKFVSKGSRVYLPQVLVEYQTEGADPRAYQYVAEHIVLCDRGIDTGRGRDKAYLVAGSFQFYLMLLQSRRNVGFVTSFDGGYMVVRPPEFGRPFSDEYEHEDPLEIIFSKAADCAMMRLRYQSRKHPGLLFSRIFTLYPSGTLKLETEFEQIPDNCRDLVLCESISAASPRFSCELNGELVTMPEHSDYDDISDFDAAQVSGNWLHFREEELNQAIIWQDSWKLGFDRCCRLELALGEVSAQGGRTSPPITLHLGQFRSSAALRQYVTGFYRKPERRYKSIDIALNDHNPVYQDVIKILPELRQKLLSPAKLIVDGVLAAESLQDAHPYEISPKAEALSVINAVISHPSIDMKLDRLMLRQSGDISIVEDKQSITIRNAELELKAFKGSELPVVAEMRYRGIEWLDPALAGFAPKARLNPYPGGMLITPAQCPPRFLLSESHFLQPDALRDQYGNHWQGISWKTELCGFEPMKGLIYKHYYLCLPGLPVLLRTVEILQAKPLAGYLSFSLQTYLNSKNVLPSASFSYLNDQDLWNDYKVADNLFRWGGAGQTNRINSQETSMYDLSGMVRYLALTCCKEFAHTKSRMFSGIAPIGQEILMPLFTVFTNLKLDHKMAEDLIYLKLEHL